MVNEQGVIGEFKGSQRTWVEVGTEVGDKVSMWIGPAHWPYKSPLHHLRVMGNLYISKIKKAFSPVLL